MSNLSRIRKRCLVDVHSSTDDQLKLGENDQKDDDFSNAMSKQNLIITSPHFSSVQLEIGNRLRDSFFDVPCVQLAKRLLGQTLVRVLNDGTVLKGKIVETESYLGKEDKASHSFCGKITARNEPMFMKPGIIYVYITYGMYYMLNISSQGEGNAVLLRAVEPLEGIDYMQKHRREFQKGKKKPTNVTKPQKSLPVHGLCNGPAKLCISFNITKSCNKEDLTVWDGMWIEKGSEDILEHQIVHSKRIGVDSAGEEWASKLLRFYVLGNKHVSKRDKVREAVCLQNTCN